MKAKFPWKLITSATFWSYPHEVTIELVQVKPRTFNWRSGSFSLAYAPAFRSASEAIEWASENLVNFEIVS